MFNNVDILSFSRMSQLMAFRYGVDIAIDCGAIKVVVVFIVPLQELYVPLLEVTERPVPNQTSVIASSVVP